MQIETSLGSVAGLDGPVQRFLGVPYAEPPGGAWRWKPPRPKRPWSGVLDCTRFGPDPLQPRSPALRGDGVGEDCLHLNVWRPRERHGPLPVMVWVPGGGFVAGAGSNATTDGAALAARGVVVVSVNYRVGVLGFLAHPALAAESADGSSGNYGLLDIVEALRWVRAHIACFGGDPSRVTAFGVSAGAACIALLLSSAAGADLFQRCILQSPGAGRPLATLDEALQAGAAALPGDAAALRALDAPQLLEAAARLQGGARSLVRPRVLRPILDGGLLRTQERQALESQAFRALPMLVGNHADEGRFFENGPAMDAHACRSWLQRDLGTDRAHEAMALYGDPAEVPVQRLVGALLGDTQFNLGASLLARCNAVRAPTWRYLFDATDAAGRPTTHTGELPSVFGTGGDAALAADVMRAWTRFACGDASIWPASDGDLLWRVASRREERGWRARELAFAASL